MKVSHASSLSFYEISPIVPHFVNQVLQFVARNKLLLNSLIQVFAVDQRTSSKKLWQHNLGA